TTASRWTSNGPSTRTCPRAGTSSSCRRAPKPCGAPGPRRRWPRPADPPWTTSSPGCSPASASADSLHPRLCNGAHMDARTEVKPIDDLRSYIAALETRGQLHRVRAEVDWKYELCHISKVNE